MEKNAKYIITVITLICIIAIVIIYNRVYDKSQSVNANLENKVENEVVEEANNNEIENSNMEETNTTNEVQEKIPEKEKINANTTGSAIYEESNDVGSTDKKQEAIDLVKQKWGEDNTVTFRCDSVASNGEYIIAVTSKTSAKVLNYFKVNLENKTVVVDY